MIPRGRTGGAGHASGHIPTTSYSQSSGSPLEEQGTVGESVDSLSQQASMATTRKFDPILEQDRFLPIANIARIMKRVIPSEGKLSKEAKECMQECVTEFLLFITSEASERCTIERRKTITGEDLVQAFSTLGFDDYVEPLRDFLRKYREANKVHGTKTDELPTTGLDNLGSANPSAISPCGLPSTSSQHGRHRLNDASDLSPVSKRSRNTNSTVDGRQLLAKIAMPSSASGGSSLPSTLQSMPMFVDIATNQYYITVQGPDGTQSLLPVTLSTAPNNAGFTREAREEIAGAVPARGDAADGDHQQTVRHYLQSRSAIKSKKTGS